MPRAIEFQGEKITTAKILKIIRLTIKQMPKTVTFSAFVLCNK